MERIFWSRRGSRSICNKCRFYACRKHGV
ncbi:hypothetical protein CQA58_01885 [Helicobacter brantae]|uniref:Uncharacterized protein n=1 Tax=Helicobacter brantae TaxID=375927 RepID=A0A3D8J3L1_9HELI|nr:hypothetical protein CQA58_01885 [Helicobacter brantae]